MFRGTYDAPGSDGAVGGCAQLTGAPPPQAIGKIQTATGQVTVMGARGVVAQVKVGDSVYRHDTIETRTDGAVGITFTDGTAFNLSNNARMVLNQFVCDGSSNSALFSLSKGAFSFIAGKVAKTGGLKIDTPFARIRGAAQDGGIGILTLAALAFSTIREIQAANRSDAFLDDGTITYKDSPHGTFEITTRDGRVIVADDPGETIVVDPAGSVARMPNSSSRMAELQQAQQNALNTLSLGLGQQGPAPGGSSTDTFNFPLQLQPINFSLPQNQGPAPLPVTITTQTNPGVIDVPTFKPLPVEIKPVLAADVSGAHAIIDTPNITGSTNLDTTPAGVLTFTHLNVSTVSASLASITWSDGATLPSGLSAVLASGLTTSVSADSTGTSGSIAATFSAPDKTFDFLAAGETLTITYNVTVTDNTGVSLTQPVTITVTGSNDAPVLAADASGPHTTTQDVQTSGTLTFTDVNLNDHHTVSTSVTSATWSGGATLPSGLDAVLAGALSATVADSTGSGSGSIAFTFGAANALDFLAAGEKLTITYDVTVTDNNGASSTQPVTIIIIGTNDPPVLAADASAPHTITKHVPTTGSISPDTSTGTLTFTDVDLSDTHKSTTSTPTFAWSGGTLTAAQQAALAAASTLTLSETDSTGSGAGSIAFSYSAADKTFDFLAFGQTLSITYEVTVTDNHGASSTEPVTITVIGTDAAPVLSNVAPTASFGAEPEPARNTPVTLSPALIVSDVDDQFLQLATVSISSGFFAGDVLAANVAGTSITASYNAATGALTLTGSDTLARYTQVLDSVTYSSTSANPTNFGTDPTRTISWVVNDGALNSAPQTTTVTIAPDFLTIPVGQTVTLNGGTLQALFIQVDGTVTGFGTIIANVITNNGTIQSKSNHTLTIEISGSIQGTGLLEITNNTTLALDGPVGSGQTVQFDIGNGPAPNLLLNDPSHFQGQISGFQGTDTIDLPTIHFDSGTTAAFSGGILTIKEGTTTIAAITFVGSPNLKIASDGHGGTLITDPPPSTTTPDATVTPVAQTPTLIATEATGAQKNVTLATVDEATAVALNTAVADPDGGKMSSLTLSGDGTAGDITDTGSGSGSSMVNSGTAAELNPISHSFAGTLADSATVDVINGKPAGAVSGPGALKIDAGAIARDHLPLQHPADNLLHMPARLDDSGAFAMTDGAQPAHPHSDVNQSATFRFDDGGAHPAHATAENISVQSKQDNDHHAIADPEINLASIAPNHLPENPPDNSLHMPGQLDGNGVLTVTDGAHPADLPVDVNQLPSFKFADDGSTHPAHATGKDASVQSIPADNGHHAIADPEISLASIAPNHLPGTADNSLHMPAQLDGNGVLTVTDGAHAADLPVDVNQLPSFKFADDGSTHPGTVPYGQPTLTALSDHLSGDYGPAAPALAKTFTVPGTVMSDAASDKFIFGKGFDHDTIADHKPDMTETDHTVPAAIQHLLDTAHDTNAVSALEPNHATTPQDMTKVQFPHHQGDFHFA